MTDRELDNLLRQSRAGETPDPAALAQVRGSILSDLRPVRPLAPTGVWVAALVAIFAAIAIAGGAILGMYGIRVLDGTERTVIFTMLAVAATISAMAVAREMVPAGRRLAHPAVIAAVAIGAFLAAFALLFHDYSLLRFARGVSCLRAGLMFAAPAALLVWLILRRGFAMDRVAAGAAAGTLAGLAGLGVLELHCPILRAPHILVWHMLVLVLSAAGGVAIGRLAARFRPGR